MRYSAALVSVQAHAANTLSLYSTKGQPRSLTAEKAMTCGHFASIVTEAFLALQVGTCDYATSCSITYAHIAPEKVAERAAKESCGWIGVTVSPVSPGFAESIGMPEPFGGIFDQPEPDSPAAAVGIEQGDVLTQIDGSSLLRASDFANIISTMPPGTQVSLWTLRNGQTMQFTLTLGSAPCRQRGKPRSRNLHQ
jgi:membrane-associated protease RseP (regulator of RpoE activity)